MKKLINAATAEAVAPDDSDDSDWGGLPASAAVEAPVADVRWSVRAQTLQARAVDAAQGTLLFAPLWKPGGHGLALSPDELGGLARYLVFSEVPAGADLIRQDERGDYLIVVLSGRIGVEQAQASGAPIRLAEARAGDILGEMSLLDAGLRSSTCTARTPCIVAVLEARRLEDMMANEPRLAMALLASLARRLSLRLRQASARLSALLSGA